MATLRGTVWDRSLLEEVPPRYRNLYTVVLPLHYALLVTFGWGGTAEPLRTLTGLFGSVEFSATWSGCLAVAALVSLVALVFRLERTELYAGVFLFVFLLLYPSSALILAVQGDAARVALAGGLPVFLLPSGWRIVDIVRTQRRRRAGA